MNMLNETTAVLKQVKETSDIPVEVITDPSLPTYARIKIARGAATHHILTYNPTKPGVDYHIAYQCGFILRLFENSPDERYEFAGTKTGHEVVRELLTKQGGGTPRMDAVMYCLDALEKFDGLTPEQVQAVTLEIAMLGRQGLDTNDPTPKYGSDPCQANSRACTLSHSCTSALSRLTQAMMWASTCPKSTKPLNNSSPGREVSPCSFISGHLNNLSKMPPVTK
jgi:hypothetical protein